MFCLFFYKFSETYCTLLLKYMQADKYIKCFLSFWKAWIVLNSIKNQVNANYAANFAVRKWVYL